MAINMMCMNEKCKNYYEDSCVKSLNNERIVIDSNGKCETFKEGVNDLYKCEWLEDGKCKHCWSEGELDCNGTDEEKAKCYMDKELE